MASEDQLLLRAVAKGNHLAFEKLYKEYFAKCYSFALYFTHSEELSKEVVAEVFLGFWKNRESLDPQSGVGYAEEKGWDFTGADRIVFRIYRGRGGHSGRRDIA